MAKFLVIGYGSIGKRHSSILRELGHTIVSVDPHPLAGADYSYAYSAGENWTKNSQDQLIIN